VVVVLVLELERLELTLGLHTTVVAEDFLAVQVHQVQVVEVDPQL
jgi:hypothetical protein